MMFFYITCNFRMLLAQETTKKVRKTNKLAIGVFQKILKYLHFLRVNVRYIDVNVFRLTQYVHVIKDPYTSYRSAPIRSTQIQAIVISV